MFTKMFESTLFIKDKEKFSKLRAQNLRQDIVMITSFRTRVSWMGSDSFVDIDIFVTKYYFIQLIFIFSIFFESLKSKSTQMLGPQKGNSGVSFYDRYSLKFRALYRNSLMCPKLTHIIQYRIWDSGFKNLVSKQMKTLMRYP